MGLRYKPWRDRMHRERERLELGERGMGEEGIHASGERSR